MAEFKKYLDTTALGTLVDQIKAEDAKVLAAAKDYTNKAPFDGAGSAATAESNAKTYADEKVQELANGTVKTNTEAIAKLNGDATTEGSVAKAVADAKALVDADVDAVEAIANKNKEDIAAINNEETGILKQAKDYTDAEVEKVQGAVDTLDTKVGDLPEDTTATSVIDYVNKKTEGIATDAALGELNAQVAGLQTAVKAIQDDYLVEADKTEFQGKIDAEAERAAGVESGLDARIKAVEDDYLKAADKEVLEGAIATAKQEAIATVLGEGTDEDFDTLKEVADWILSDTTGAAGLQTDVATLKQEMDTVEEKVQTLEGEMDAVEGAVATKVETETFNAKVEALEGVDAGQETRIAALEAKFGEGEGNVEDMIADAVADGVADAVAQAEAKDAEILAQAKTYADEEDAKIEERVATLETASGTHALKSEVEAVAGRVTTVEGKVGTLETEMDAVELLAAAADAAAKANAQALELKASQEDLDKAVSRIAVNEGAIVTINETLVDKAEADDLDAAVERISANESAIAANTSAINSFTPISSDEVNALFA